ncbi:hypothetical protein QJS66_14015 [Kocuria rhizophila]|nr:hypothetical protein QJS66_14015 [Kocuria rhizophila]
MTGGTEVACPSETDAVVGAVTTPRAASAVPLNTRTTALEKALASGDLSAWRLFLHPGSAGIRGRENLRAVPALPAAQRARPWCWSTSGALGARTQTRVLVVSYTRNLVDMIAHIRALDPRVRMAGQLGQPRRRGDDARSGRHRVLGVQNGSQGLSQAMEEVVGSVSGPSAGSSGACGASPWG